MKIVIRIIRRIIFCMCLLYGYNLIAINFNMVIPINIYTSLFVCFFGTPSIFSLLLFKMFVLWGEFYGIDWS